ncbi:MAG: TRAP transporter small permease [Alphaproteobacteria bacterium]
MRKSLDRIYNLSGYIAAFCIFAICLIVFIQVVFNIIDKISAKFTGEVIGLMIPSYTEIAGFLLTGASFFALAYTFKKGGHIRVSLILQVLPKSVQRICNIFALILCFSLATYAVYFCVMLTYESFVYNDLSGGLIAIPVWIPQTFMSIGLAVFAIALLDDLLCYLWTKETPFSLTHHGEEA